MSDVFISENSTSGVVLRDLISEINSNDVVTALILQPGQKYENTIQSMTEKVYTVYGSEQSWSGANPMNKIIRYFFNKDIERIIRCLDFIVQEEQISHVIVCLQGQTMIALADNLVQNMRNPVSVIIWDKFEWWAYSHNYPESLIQHMNGMLRSIYSKSTNIVVPSKGMASEIKEISQTSNIRVLYPLRVNVKSEVKNRNSSFKIVFAGQLYAEPEVIRLSAAVNLINRQRPGQKIEFHIYGHYNPAPVEHIETIFHSYQERSELIQSLANFDAFFLPYPLASPIREFTLTSFPSKASIYSSYGKPIIYNGDLNSEFGKLLMTRGFSLMIGEASTTNLKNLLSKLIDSKELQNRESALSLELNKDLFSPEQFSRTVQEIFGTKPSLLKNDEYLIEVKANRQIPHTTKLKNRARFIVRPLKKLINVKNRFRYSVINQVKVRIRNAKSQQHAFSKIK